MHPCIPPPGPIEAARERVSDRNGSADETPQGGSAGAQAQVERGQAIRPETPRPLAPATRSSYLPRRQTERGTRMYYYGRNTRCVMPEDLIAYAWSAPMRDLA